MSSKYGCVRYVGAVVGLCVTGQTLSACPRPVFPFITQLKVVGSVIEAKLVTDVLACVLFAPGAE
jgi:hypothetical protein